MGWERLKEVFPAARRCNWVNLGGQLARASDVDILIQKIQKGRLTPGTTCTTRTSASTSNIRNTTPPTPMLPFLELHGLPEEAVTPALWKQWLEQSVEIARLIALRTRESREKDYNNPFRQATYDNAEEMQAVLGNIDDNSFIREMEVQAGRFEEKVKKMIC
jgi:hypothetical protein